MNATASIVCKAFLERSPPEKQAKLLRFLSAHDQQNLQELPVSYHKDPTEGFSTEEALLKRIHYSWLDPLFRTFSESEVGLFLSALDPLQAKGLKKLLLFSNHGASLTKLGRTFLQKTLWKRLSDEQIVPIECLPESPLNVLLELETDDLLLMISFLGLHDLGAEVKQIIETAKLKQIYAALSPSELAFLKTLLHRKEPLTFKRLDLQTWDGKKASLRQLLDQRGINRLAKALYRKEKSLLWHVSHRLDREIGEALVKLSTPLEHVRAQEILIGQVTELLPLIQTQQPS
ncbi:MAG: hypothetical protein HYX48_02305 [Chlamydiales bacterium]|nr:hypothetical protein [Chlamydiales bacterium]